MAQRTHVLRITFTGLALALAACSSGGPAPEWSPSELEHQAMLVRFSTRGDGSGTDRDAASRLEAIVSEYQPVRRQMTVWGLEGERDICFVLDGVASAARAELVHDVEEAMRAGDHVETSVDVSCPVTLAPG